MISILLLILETASILMKIFRFVFFYLVYSWILCSYNYYFCLFFTKVPCYTLNQTCLVTFIWRNFIRNALRITFLHPTPPPLPHPLQNEPVMPLCRHQSLKYCNSDIHFLTEGNWSSKSYQIFICNMLLQSITTSRIIAAITKVPCCFQGQFWGGFTST